MKRCFLLFVLLCLFCVPRVSAQTNVKTAATTPHSVTLTWTPSTSTGVTGYSILRSQTSGGPYTRIGSVVNNFVQYTDTNVVAGQTYYYVVEATSGSVFSVPSNQVSAVIPGGTGGTPPTISGTFPWGTVGVAYSSGLTASGGTPPYTWSMTGAVPGLSLVTSTGDLTGTPTTAGSFPVSFIAKDSTGLASPTDASSVTIAAATITHVQYMMTPSKTSLTFSGTVGGVNPVAQSISVSDTTPCPPPAGIAVCHWPIVISSSKPWLTVSPTSGTTSFSFTASVNLSGLTAATQTAALTLTVTPTGGQILGNSPVTIPVTLNLTGAPPPPPGFTCQTTSAATTTVVLACTISGFSKGQTGIVMWTPTGGAGIPISITHP